MKYPETHIPCKECNGWYSHDPKYKMCFRCKEKKEVELQGYYDRGLCMEKELTRLLKEVK